MILIKNFPAQIAAPYRVTCRTESQFYKTFNALNGIKPKIFFSLYNCNNAGKFINPNIDKIAFDIDCENSLKIVRKIDKYCDALNLKRTFIFSTGGFWAYIFTSNGTDLEYPKNALKNSQIKIIEDIGLTYKERNKRNLIDPHMNDIDFHILGDIARVARMPGSFDKNRKRFCISVSKTDLSKGMEHIIEKSKRQSFDLYVYGENLLDLKKYDEQPSIIESTDIPDFDYSYKRTGIPPCVWSWITVREKAVYRARYFATVWLKEYGWTKTMIRKLLKENYENFPRTDGLNNNWEHYKKVKVLDLVFEKDLTFPTCQHLYVEGLCDGKCKYFGNANLYADEK